MIYVFLKLQKSVLSYDFSLHTAYVIQESPSESGVSTVWIIYEFYQGL